MLYAHIIKVIAQKIMFMCMTNGVNVELNLNYDMQWMNLCIDRDGGMGMRAKIENSLRTRMMRKLSCHWLVYERIKAVDALKIHAQSINVSWMSCTAFFYPCIDIQNTLNLHVHLIFYVSSLFFLFIFWK